MKHNAEVYPKRVIWMQEEDTLKWMLVGLSDDGEVQDPRDYEDVRAPLSNQPSGRVWMRDEATGKWTNLLVEASKEELHKAETAIRRRPAGHDDHPNEVKWTHAERRSGSAQKLPPPATRPQHRPKYQQRGATIHQRYAQRLSGSIGGGVDAISEEEAYDQAKDLPADGIGKDGVKYHNIKPSDTFNFICLKYKISADALREANNFVGSTLKDAPKRLVIPPPKVDEKKDKESSEKKSVKTVDDSALEQKQPLAGPSRVENLNSIKSPISPIAPRKQPPQLGSPTRQPQEEVKYHWIEPDDSLRWICLKYKVNANDLRRANNFTGSNLKLAPKKLIIPKPSNVRKKSSRPPRPRKMRSNGSLGSVDSYGSSALTSSLLTAASYPLKEEDIDDSSNVGSIGQAASPKPTPREVLGQATSGTGADMSPLPNFPVIGEYSADLAPPPYRNLGSQGSEALASMAAAANPAPVAMVHLTMAKKLYDQMSCDTDSSDSMDGSGDERDFEAPSSMNGSFRSSKSNQARYHDVRPTDTVEYLCLKYRVSAAALRRANIGLTGRNLQTGPKRLIIPASTTVTSNPANPLATSFKSFRTKETRETHTTHETETVTTHDDDTNTIALSDGQSTLAEQMQSLELLDDEEVLYHEVQPSDTLQGICLRYGISAYELRRANNFRGLNLQAAPDRLAIPKNERQSINRKIRDFETMSHEEKIQVLIAHLPVSRQTKKPILSYDEARVYLEYNDWNFDQALRNAKVDAEWSSQKSRSTPIRGTSTNHGMSAYR